MDEQHSKLTLIVGILALFSPAIVMLVPSAVSAQECSISDRTYPPRAPVVNLMPSHKIISSKQTSKWFKNSTKAAVTEYVKEGNCPSRDASTANGRSCSPKRTCGAGRVCDAGYDHWASCPEDAGPVEWDDEPYNSNPEDPEEGPSLFNDNQDTGEQGPCMCWHDDSDPLAQRPCTTSADCSASKMCVDGRCRCPDFNWDDCDTLRFGLTTFDEAGCQSNLDEFTNNMAEEMEEEETGQTSMDVRDEVNKLKGSGTSQNYCNDTSYRPLAGAMLEYQREEKFRSDSEKLSSDYRERSWSRAHINMLYIRDLPTTLLGDGTLATDVAVKDSLVRGYHLLDGKALRKGTTDDYRTVPPILTYVLHYSNPDSPGGTCERDGDRLEVFSGMLAAVGGTGKCCYDANSDGDCVDGNDVSLSEIGTPTGLYEFIEPKDPATLLAEIKDGKYRCGVTTDKASDPEKPEYASTTTRTGPDDTGSPGACKTGGLACQLGGPEAHGSCGGSYLGDSDIFADAACVRLVPEERTFEEMNYRYCEKESNGTETCKDLTEDDVEFLDPNDKMFRVDEDIGAEGKCVGYFEVNRCPNVGDLCTTDDGCQQGVVKCVDGEEVCTLPESPLPDETSCDGKDNDCDGVIDDGQRIVGQAGTTDGLEDDTWGTATFETGFSSGAPVVLATPQTQNDSEAPSHAHVGNVTSTGLETQHCELDVGSPSTCDTHPAETNGWFGIDPATLDGSKGIQAGTYESSSGTEVHDAVFFDYEFDSRPLVFSTVQTVNESDVPRTVHPVDVQPQGAVFEFCEQDSDTGCGAHASETVGWLAVNPDTNDFNGVEVGEFQQGDGSGGWHSVSFSTNFEGPPVVLAEAQTENGGEEAMYGEVRNVTENGAEIRVCEYDGNDGCDWHLDERVAWIAIGQGDVTAGKPNICNTGEPGRCSLGTCEVGPSTACNQLKRPVPEVCNGIDDDCDGTVDNIEGSWEKSWSVDTTDEAHELACAKEAACSCPEPDDRDDQYRGGPQTPDEPAGTVDDEFDEMAAETIDENTDGDSDFATKCRCSE